MISIHIHKEDTGIYKTEAESLGHYINDLLYKYNNDCVEYMTTEEKVLITDKTYPQSQRYTIYMDIDNTPKEETEWNYLLSPSSS